MSDDKRVHILAEQGDMGLWDTPVTAAEQQALNEQGKNKKEKETDNKQN